MQRALPDDVVEIIWDMVHRSIRPSVKRATWRHVHEELLKRWGELIFTPLCKRVTDMYTCMLRPHMQDVHMLLDISTLVALASDSDFESRYVCRCVDVSRLLIFVLNIEKWESMELPLLFDYHRCGECMMTYVCFEWNTYRYVYFEDPCWLCAAIQSNGMQVPHKNFS